jgi:type II secretory pathway component GspD/PulD (secretin)
MKYWLSIMTFLVCLACQAIETPHSGPSKDDLKQAAKNFQHAIELQKAGKLDEAFQAATAATSLAPANVEYATGRELLRLQMAGNHLQRGNLLAETGNNAGAAEQFLAALAIDGQNAYAQQRLRDVSPPENTEHAHILKLLASVDQIQITPKPGTASFHVRGDTRALYDQIAKAFGVSVVYEQTLTPHQVRFDVQDVDFYTAMKLAGQVTKTFWSPLSNVQAFVANDSQEMRRQYERLSLRTFYVNNVAVPTDLNDLVNVIRTVFEVRLVSLQAAKNTIIVRAPKEQLDQIAPMMDELMAARPEVLVDLKAYEIDTDKLREMGLALPNDFTIFNIPFEIYRVLGPAAKPIIDQLLKTGTIDPTKVPIGALSQLQGSPLLAPFIFFGGGYGLTGISTPPISGRLSFSNSVTKSLEHVVVRASDGNAATLRIGTRFPILTSSFTNVSVGGNGNPVVGNSFPSVQYEDLGVTLKTTPHYHFGEQVTLEMELQIRGLGGQQLNGVPDITNREFKGTITVKDGEPAVIAGSVTDQENRSTKGYPALGQIPVLSAILNTNSKEHLRQEILVVVTPHVIRKAFRETANAGDLNNK